MSEVFTFEKPLGPNLRPEQMPTLAQPISTPAPPPDTPQLTFENPLARHQEHFLGAGRQPRCIPVIMQALGAGGTIVNNLQGPIPYPYVIRSAWLWAPGATPATQSDGKVGIWYGENPTNSSTAIQTMNPLFAPWFPPAFLYCPTLVVIEPLWVIVDQPNSYIGAVGTSQGGATNIYLVAGVIITPLTDLIGPV